MAFRILWHDGWPYPVTGHPFHYGVEESHWYVQTRDGTWRPIVRRDTGSSLEKVWYELEPVVHDWLTANVPSGAHELPPMLVVEVALHPSAGTFGHERSLLARTVSTERGDCDAELATLSVPPGFSPPDAARHTQTRDPALFTVRFRTADHPRGVHLRFDATEFLETVVQRYLWHRPTDTPISQPSS